MYSICHMLTISKAHLHVALLQTTLDFHIQPSTLQLDLEVQINISNSLCPKSNSKSSPPKLLLTQTFFILINGNCIPLIALHKNLEVMTPLTLLHHIYQQFLINQNITFPNILNSKPKQNKHDSVFRDKLLILPVF